jgi:hypothetical protein
MLDVLWSEVRFIPANQKRADVTGTGFKIQCVDH